MKVFAIPLLCALVSGAAAGVVDWPGAPVAVSSPYLKTILPAQTKAFGFSTTQYINTLPASYSVQYQPQYAFQIPQLSGFAPPQPAYYPIAGPSYFPSNNLFFPSNPIASLVPGLPGTPISPAAPAAPIIPSRPTGLPPSSPPEQQAGDADTAVIDSADFPQDQQQVPAATEAPIQSQPSELPPANTFPNFPTFPQGSEGPQFPQLPQGPPSFPQIPQGPSFPQIPQFPQGSAPSFPQFPQFPTNPSFPQGPPSSPPSTFPGGPSGDKGLNDEDTISVESA